MTQIKAIHHTKPGDNPADVLALKTIDAPEVGENDLYVNIKACAVNPVDTKIRLGKFPADDVTGFDAAGIVQKIGSKVPSKSFRPGDEVYYSGALGRQGSTATHNLVDYRLAALKPKSLDMVNAAAVPLVSITAWELFEEHFNLVPGGNDKQSAQSMLIINGAGGVGTIGTQLARKVFKLGKVIVTASREETIQHAKKMGATDVINHHEKLKPQLEKLGVCGEHKGVDYIMICYDTNAYMDQVVDVAGVKAHIGSIVETEVPLPGLHKPDAFMKALSFHWELMLSKGVHGYDLESQGAILSKVAQLYDSGTLIPLLNDVPGELSVANLVKAHQKLESGKAIGKIALTVGDDIQ